MREAVMYQQPEPLLGGLIVGLLIPHHLQHLPDIVLTKPLNAQELTARRLMTSL